MKGKSGLIPVASFFPAYVPDEIKAGPPTDVALLVLAQHLAGLTVEQMHLGAGGAHDPFILVFGNIWIVIHLMLDVEPGRRAPENEMGHRSGYDGPANQTMM